MSSPKSGKTAADAAGETADQARAKAAENNRQAADAADDEGGEDDEAAGSSAFLHTAPSWLVSMIFHAILFLIMALLTVDNAKPAEKVSLITAPETQDEMEELEEFEIEELEFEDEQLDTYEAFTQDMGAINFGEIKNDLVNAEVEVDGLGEDSDLNEIAALFGTKGDGLSKVGDGMGGAKFFGVESKGLKFVFVLDNSLSMNNGRFETACTELMYTIKRMSSKHQFYVYFFSDTAYPLFYPQSQEGWAYATQANIYRLGEWLKGIHLVLWTDAQSAVEKALAMKPNAIYILTDGAFTDHTYQYLMGLKDNKIPIHTVGMEIKGQAEQHLKDIAAKHNGTYRLVGTLPEAREFAKNVTRPRHKKPGPIWGIALGQRRAAAKKGPGKKPPANKGGGKPGGGKPGGGNKAGGNKAAGKQGGGNKGGGKK